MVDEEKSESEVPQNRSKWHLYGQEKSSTPLMN